MRYSLVYNAAISLYRFGVRLASLNNKKARLLNRGQNGVWRKLKSSIDPDADYIWFHAASLGEFEQGRPMIERLKREHPEYKILLTFFSPSGYEVRKNYSGADCVCYLPFDTTLRVSHFLNIVRPKKAIFIKYEFWRNYLYGLKRRRIETYLISAVFRKDQLFFKKTTSWYANWLRCFDRIFVQDTGSRDLLAGIGIRNVDVCGDTRFDRVSEIRSSARKIPLLEKFCEDSPLVVMAGSSWPTDETIYADWFNSHPDVKLVIAPHEFDEERLIELESRFVNGAVRMSKTENSDENIDSQVLIIDCFGLLSSAYAYCDIAYVGGGFGAGLHNINEAAVYDIPVIYGPNNKKFIEARELAEWGGGFPVSSKSEFEKVMDNFNSNQKLIESAGECAGKYIKSKLGATDRIYDIIFKK